jgi:serine/threonine-protein kinase
MTAEAFDLRDRVQDALRHTYRLERELGGGGMSRVFVAQETALGRTVVIKVLAPELAAGVSAERFEREIRLIARLQHPHIVPVLAAGHIDDLPYYTMPFVAGASLRSRLSGEALSITEAVAILRDMARALDFAHREGIVHRDVKPENVLLADGIAVVTDFGIARAVSAARTATHQESLTQLGSAIGTPAYMAPEQAAGDPGVDTRADIYAFGVVAYELLAGRHPFAARRSAQQLIVAHLTETPVTPTKHRPAVTAALADLVLRCLAKDPAERPRTARAVLDALDRPPNVHEGAASVGAHAAPPPRPAVAVLPFANLTSDPENEYLSDGITEEIIGSLARLGTVRVAGRASSFALKGQRLDARTVAERLNVGAVVEGSVRRTGNRLRVAAELVDAADGFQRWSERYDREITDLFDVQDEIARAIADALSTHLTTPSAPPGRSESGVAPTKAVDPEAYRLYLRARHLLRTQFTPDAYRRAMALLDQALERDPKLARVHSTRAVAYNNLAIFSLRSAHEVFPQARESARIALSLDDTVAEAHTILAQMTYGYDWRWDDAERVFERALAAGPDDTGTLMRASLFHAASSGAGGRHEAEAMRLMRRAMDLEPLSGWERFVAGTILWLLRRNSDALVPLQEAVELAPQHGLSIMTLAGVYRDLGQFDEAVPMMEHAVELTRRNPLVLTNAAALAAKTGDHARAANLADELVARSATEWTAPYYVAQALGWAGRLEDAFAWLDRAVDAHDFWLVMAGGDQLSDPLRGDARFSAMMHRVGIPGR